MNGGRQRLAGAFAKEEEAVAAVKQLQQQGFAPEEIFVIGQNYGATEHLQTSNDDFYEQQVEEGKTLVLVSADADALLRQKLNPGEAGLDV